MGVFVNFDTTSSVLFALIAATLIIGILLRAPPPHLHPFILGRQSIPSQSRNPGESAVYLNSITSGTRAPVRPEKGLGGLWDALQPSFARFGTLPAGTWIKGGEKVNETVVALRAGLLSTLGKGEGQVAVLVDDPTDALLVTLALILTDFTPLVIAPGSTLPASASVVGIISSSTRFTSAAALSASPDAKHIALGGADEKSSVAEDLLVTGQQLVANGEASSVVAAEPNAVALTIVSEGVSLTFTHMNLTASLVSWLSIFPLAPKSLRPGVRDVVTSFHHPSTPYGFGLALLAIYTSSTLIFPVLDSPITHEAFTAWLKDTPPSSHPTHLFGATSVIQEPLYMGLLSTMLDLTGWILTNARDAKLRLLREGVLAKDSGWDGVMFKHVAGDYNMAKLKMLVFDGPAPASHTESLRSIIGCPVFSTLSHPFVLAPIAAQHAFDLQRLPPPGVTDQTLTGKELGHVGPPVPGVEFKLKGEEEDFASGRVRGEILIRTPMLPPANTFPDSVLVTDETLPPRPAYPGQPKNAAAEGAGAKWLKTAIRAELATEGTLWIQ